MAAQSSTRRRRDRHNDAAWLAWEKHEQGMECLNLAGKRPPASKSPLSYINHIGYTQAYRLGTGATVLGALVLPPLQVRHHVVIGLDLN